MKENARARRADARKWKQSEILPDLVDMRVGGDLCQEVDEIVQNGEVLLGKPARKRKQPLAIQSEQQRERSNRSIHKAVEVRHRRYSHRSRKINDTRQGHAVSEKENSNDT